MAASMKFTYKQKRRLLEKYLNGHLDRKKRYEEEQFNRTLNPVVYPAEYEIHIIKSMIQDYKDLEYTGAVAGTVSTQKPILF